MSELTDEEILETADPLLVLNKRLQLAHDRMLLCSEEAGSYEYAVKWREYLDAGGNRTMIELGIDNNNWQRHRKEAA